jgi:hypothetical protein
VTAGTPVAAAPGDTDRRRRRLAGWTFVVTCLLFAAGIGLAVRDGLAGARVSAGNLLFQTAMLSFALVGVLVARREPRNPVAWILLAIGLSWAVDTAFGAYTHLTLVTRSGSLPGGALTGIVGSSMWVPAIGLMGTFLLLLFPDGRLPSRPVRVLARMSGASIAATTVVLLFTPGSLADDGYPTLSNPLGVHALKGILQALEPSIVLIPLCIVASAVALVVRFRRSRGIERLQLKWLVAAGAVVAAIYAIAMVASFGQPWGQASTTAWVALLQNLAITSFVLIPASIGVAILRYRLYDIDRLISRTIAYSLLTAVLVGVYAAIVVGVGAATGRTDNPAVIAGATLAVAALFRPVRRRIQSVIDRRLYRRRYDADRVMAEFTSRLRDELDLDAVSTELAGAAASAVQPATVGVWIRRKAARR